MKRIMFVCTGNICRSAMAEFLMRSKLESLDLKEKVEISSAGTYAYSGDTPTYEALSVMMNEYGIDMSTHKATPIRSANVEDMDFIFCMTNSHKYTLNVMYPDMKDKIFLLKEYVSLGKEISDPYGFGVEVYSNCAKEISECLDLLIKKMFGSD